MPFIPYGRQQIDQDDIDAVVEVLQSDWLTQGPMVPRFEQAVAGYCGVAYGAAANSATSTLHLACMALDLGPGDWLWTSPNTFVASANCGLYCGADVDFVDIDPQTWNMCPAKLEAKLDAAGKSGRLPKILIPVHLCGQSCDMRAIHELSLEYGFHVIEDASHAIGAGYRGEPVGSCRYSDITVFSFHPVKIITTAEGGMAMTGSADLAERMSSLRTHGITRDSNRFRHQSAGPWYYEQNALGYNYRMTDIQAALGLSQMTRLEAFIERRRELARRYDESLAGLPLKLPKVIDDAASSWHLYPVRLDRERVARSHREVFEALRDGGIGVNLHYMPVHLQPFYRDRGFSEGDFPEAEAYAREAISLPLFAGLSDRDQDQVIDALLRAL